MSDEKLEFLDQSQNQPEAEEAEQPEPQEQVEAEAEQPEPELVEEDTGEEPSEPPSPQPEPTAVPLTSLLDEREKRQALERKLQALEAQQRAASQQQQAPAPDLYDDPDKRLQYERTQLEEARKQDKLQTSKFFAERDFGKEVVDEAIAYFDSNPAQSNQFLNHPSPFHAAVDYYKKQKFLSEVGDDPEAYIQRQVEERMQAATLSAQPSKPKAPPASLAKAPSTGKETIARGSGFDLAIPK